MLESETLSYIIDASETEIHGLTLKERERVSTTTDQTCKSLQGGWIVKEYTSSNNDADDGVLANDAKRNRIIQIKVGKGKQEALDHLSILGIYTKTYKKLYIDSVSQKWNRDISEG